MEKKKTSIRIAQESRKKNNKTGYFIGYITVMNGMSAFALAVAWCWGCLLYTSDAADEL